MTQPIDIVRPVGDYRAFERPVTLSGSRYVLLIEPSEPTRGSGLWLTTSTVTGTVLARSIRMTPSSDLWGLARGSIDGLPPGRLQLVASADPRSEDLWVPGLVALSYEVD